jgi:hypothetical protein
VSISTRFAALSVGTDGVVVDGGAVVDGSIPVVDDAGELDGGADDCGIVVCEASVVSTVVALHYVEDMSLDTIANVLGIATGTVKSLLFSARKSLAKTLGAKEPQS